MRKIQTHRDFSHDRIPLKKSHIDLTFPDHLESPSHKRAFSSAFKINSSPRSFFKKKLYKGRTIQTSSPEKQVSSTPLLLAQGTQVLTSFSQSTVNPMYSSLPALPVSLKPALNRSNNYTGYLKLKLVKRKT